MRRREGRQWPIADEPPRLYQIGGTVGYVAALAAIVYGAYHLWWWVFSWMHQQMPH